MTEILSLLLHHSPLGDHVTNGIDRLSVMLNLFQHLIESMCYETLKRVQGDKKGITTQSLGGEGKGEGGYLDIG